MTPTEMTEMTVPTVAFSTLGCKVNYSEAEALARRFIERGYRIVPFEETADVYVVNTCTVTHVADRKSRGEIRAAARRNPAALVAATGCYVSVANHGLGDVLPGNVLIVANAEKDRLVELVESERAARQSCTSLALEPDAPVVESRARLEQAPPGAAVEVEGSPGSAGVPPVPALDRGPAGSRRSQEGASPAGEPRTLTGDGPEARAPWEAAGGRLEAGGPRGQRPARVPTATGVARFGAASALPVPLAPSSLVPLRAAATPAALGRTRANLKVQDGCNAGCAFCIIPRARGGPRSVPLAEAIEAAQRLEEWGYREIVISGVLLGSYGRDLPDAPRLHDLLAAMLECTREVRVRVSSVEPQDVDRDLFALWRNPRLCRHLHLPLQSGSTAILHAMRRKYDADWYAAMVRAAVEDIPGVALTIDMMVGFPGENELLFEQSYSLAESLPLAGMHVFKYSPRRGTAAARFAGQVPEPEKDRRSARLRALAARQSERFRRAQLGATLPVLWEERQGGMWSGLTDNYIRVYSRDERLSANTISPTRLVEPFQDGVLGVWQKGS